MISFCVTCTTKIDNKQKEVLLMKELLTITETAKIVGVSARTIQRWEETGKVTKAKRDKRGQRVYGQNDIAQLRTLHLAMLFS